MLILDPVISKQSISEGSILCGDILFAICNIYVSLRLRVQNAVSAQPCVGKFRISLVLLNFLHCNFTLWFETP